MFFLTFVFVFSCKKESEEPVESHYDFRDVFVGKYHVTETINCYGPCGSCSSSKDTIISVYYGSSDSSMNVLGRNIFLDADGYFYDYHYSLRLWNDSISSYYANGGLGCGQNEVYLGNKISDTP